ncbi:hypothetical protein HK099_007162 [Clydaea vesicula]|uniref:Uncharacterized protein n=1 Tax=Clydaea vesicula TaxID=447962 RepID=A0AAD5XYN1_9FUNG|nr:hypothetical protein HK099_007162 [Clydaea vesicula]
MFKNEVADVEKEIKTEVEFLTSSQNSVSNWTGTENVTNVDLNEKLNKDSILEILASTGLLKQLEGFQKFTEDHLNFQVSELNLRIEKVKSNVDTLKKKSGVSSSNLKSAKPTANTKKIPPKKKIG